MHASRFALFSLALLLLALFAACAGRSYPHTPDMNGKRFRHLLDLAAQDLSCPEELAYEFSDAIHTVRGCGRSEQYALYCFEGLCQWLKTPRKQAEFDLACPFEQLRVVNLDPQRWGVMGCDRRASYVAICPQTVPYRCQWVPDTTSVGLNVQAPVLVVPEPQPPQPPPDGLPEARGMPPQLAP